MFAVSVSVQFHFQREGWFLLCHFILRSTDVTNMGLFPIHHISYLVLCEKTPGKTRPGELDLYWTANDHSPKVKDII